MLRAKRMSSTSPIPFTSLFLNSFRKVRTDGILVTC